MFWFQRETKEFIFLRLYIHSYFLSSLFSQLSFSEPYDLFVFYATFITLPSIHILRTMTSSFGMKKQLPIPFVVNLQGFILINNRSYVPKPPMEKKKTVIWASHVLILFSLIGIVHVFMGLYLDHLWNDPNLKSSSHVHHQANLTRLELEALSLSSWNIPTVCSVLIIPPTMILILVGCTN